jgi:ABC-type nickel/cobalt efflux system permease component RcnA
MTFLSSDPFQSVSDFFGSSVWTIALVLIQVFAAALWLALAYWVYQDARRRFENSGAITACVAIALIIPFLGALIYMFIRPPEYLTDAHDRELETLALESQVEGLRCLSCDGVVGPRFLVCPNCTASLRQPCRRCSEPLEPHWQVCPYCAAPAAPTSSRTLDDTRIERRRRDDTNQDPEPGIS